MFQCKEMISMQITGKDHPGTRKICDEINKRTAPRVLSLEMFSSGSFQRAKQHQEFEHLPFASPQSSIQDPSHFLTISPNQRMATRTFCAGALSESKHPGFFSHRHRQRLDSTHSTRLSKATSFARPPLSTFCVCLVSVTGTYSRSIYMYMTCT